MEFLIIQVPLVIGGGKTWWVFSQWCHSQLFLQYLKGQIVFFSTTVISDLSVLPWDIPTGLELIKHSALRFISAWQFLRIMTVAVLTLVFLEFNGIAF